jgi:hypothetical protein
MLNAAHSSSRSHSHCFRDILHMPVLLRPCLGKLSITHNSAWSLFWSSVGGKPYPVSLRVLSFEQNYQRLDEEYTRPGAQTFAHHPLMKKQKQCRISHEVSVFPS